MEDKSESEGECEETMENSSESEQEMEDSSEEEIIDNAEIRKKLLESGIIGRVLDDFMPCMLLHVIYEEKIITLDNKLWLGQVQTEPDNPFLNFWKPNVMANT